MVPFEVRMSFGVFEIETYVSGAVVMTGNEITGNMKTD
jgi:hypothetical protein